MASARTASIVPRYAAQHTFAKTVVGWGMGLRINTPPLNASEGGILVVYLSEPPGLGVGAAPEV